MDDEFAADKRRWLANVRRALQHPIRNRIIAALNDGQVRSQHELGQELSMSNAAVHYHVKLLFNLRLLKLASTRPGPNAIVEKLYALDVETWNDVAALTGTNPDLHLYVEYVVSWMHERHREGLALIARDPAQTHFLAGSYEVRAPLAEIAAFKKRIRELFVEFSAKHEADAGRDDMPAHAVTFSLFPARGKDVAESQYLIEYSPE